MKTKSNKKKVFVTALCVCLIAILSFGTLAWFTSEDSVTNTFKFASSNEDGSTDFDVDVYEKGKEDTSAGEGDDENGFVYDNVLPGDTYVKTAIVKNTSSTGESVSGSNYSQYIRVHIEIAEDGKIFEHYVGAGENLTVENNVDADAYAAVRDMLQSIDEDDWIVQYCKYDSVNEKYEITLYLKEVLEPDNEVTVFEKFVVPSSLTVADANDMGNDFTVEITAEAIQSDNLVDADGKVISGPRRAFNQLVGTAKEYWEEN